MKGGNGMETDLLQNPMIRLMYENALNDLSNGVVSPVDKHVLSDIPLPPDFVDPYAAEDMEGLAAMNLAYNSLSAWIEEAKKAVHTSCHFLTLSKLIMSGVTAVARGLATLHAMGKPLDQAPMKIEDLISVGSYHIRKSYLGVLQTVKSNPEFSGKLLLNQLSWTNTLMRLYKTKEKLEQAPKIKIEQPVLGTAADKDPGLSNQTTDALPENKTKALPEVSPLSQPGRYAPHRAFSPIHNTGTVTGDSELSPRGLSRQETDHSDEIRNRKSEIIDKKSEIKNEPADETQNIVSNNNEEDTKISYSKECSEQENENRKDEITETTEIRLDPQTYFTEEYRYTDQTPYQTILEQVRKRNEKNPDGVIEFTSDEICLLILDPKFIRDYPQLSDRLARLIEFTDDG